MSFVELGPFDVTIKCAAWKLHDLFYLFLATTHQFQVLFRRYYVLCSRRYIIELIFEFLGGYVSFGYALLRIAINSASFILDIKKDTVTYHVLWLRLLSIDRRVTY